MTMLSKFIVTFEIDYLHRVEIGVDAHNVDAALQLAESAFNTGTLWDEHSPEKLLHDDFHEEGEAMERYVTQLDDRPFPRPDASVHELELHTRARSLLDFCRMISDAAPSLTEQVVDLDRLFDVPVSARSIQKIRELLPHLAAT